MCFTFLVFDFVIGKPTNFPCIEIATSLLIGDNRACLDTPDKPLPVCEAAIREPKHPLRTINQIFFEQLHEPLAQKLKGVC